MKKLILIGLATLTLIAQETITICGTGDSQEILRILASSYSLKHPNSEIIVPNSIGSGGGIKNTAIKRCDLGRVAREIKDKEKKYNLNYMQFALSPVVFVVNPSVKNIKNITTKNIIDIYSGKINRWEELGISYSGKIYAARRELGDSSNAVLISNLQGYKEIKKYVGKTIFNTPDTVKTLVKYKNTIGYIPYSFAIEKKLTVLSLDGYFPNIENIKNKKYKLTTAFGLVYRDDLNNLSKKFIKFIQSKEAKNIMAKNGVFQWLR